MPSKGKIRLVYGSVLGVWWSTVGLLAPPVVSEDDTVFWPHSSENESSGRRTLFLVRIRWNPSMPLEEP